MKGYARIPRRSEQIETSRVGPTVQAAIASIHGYASVLKTQKYNIFFSVGHVLP